MKRNKGNTSIELILVFIVGFAIIGWGMNIYKLTNCDFETPYKAEVIRSLGIFIAPMGSLIGYLDLGN